MYLSYKSVALRGQRLNLSYLLLSIRPCSAWWLHGRVCFVLIHGTPGAMPGAQEILIE